MPRISEFYGVVVAMFHTDHNPPHFHAVYGGYKAQISIEDSCIIEGWLPARARAMVIEWAKIHQSELRKEWELARKHKPLFWIDPLE